MTGWLQTCSPTKHTVVQGHHPQLPGTLITCVILKGTKSKVNKMNGSEVEWGRGMGRINNSKQSLCIFSEWVSQFACTYICLILRYTAI